MATTSTRPGSGAHGGSPGSPPQHPGGPEAGTAPHRRERGSTTALGMVVKLIGLGTVAGLAMWVTPALFAGENWLALVGLWAATVAIFVVYSTKRFIPAKYLLPGTLFLLVFLVYPIIYTAQLSTTNFGDGTRGTKEETIETIVSNSVQQVADSRRYNLTVGTTDSVTDGPFTFFLVESETGTLLRGDGDGVQELDPDEITVTDDHITAAEGFELLDPRQVNDASAALADFVVPTGAGAIRALGISTAVEGAATLQYDEDSDTLTDLTTGEVLTVELQGDREYFVTEDGTRAFNQSWRRDVGLSNYERVLTNPVIRADFLRIFTWTMVFSVGSVASTFLLGLGLAVVLNDSRMRGRKVYRSVLLLPYAIPGFISLLVWRSFYNRDFGLINDLTGLDLDWFGDPTLAKVAVLLTNLWIGFPYMFVVCTGALQAIPAELKEAATMDGARPFIAFRRVVFPLLLVAVAPLLVASFAFNFNNFNAIELLTGGAPFSAANPTAGYTDILISYTFRLAFGGTGAQIGFAAAISVLLFFLTAVIATFQFRYTRALEDVN